MKKRIIPKGPKPVVRCAYTEMVPLSKLKPHELNPNTHSPEQIEFFVGVLKYQGIRRPITVSKRSGFITRGHGLLEAIRKCGWSEAPVDYQSYDSDEQELADIVADNELARLSMTDRKLLDALALKLPQGFDLKLLAIPKFELPKAPGTPGCGEDEVPEPPKKPKAKLGDLFELGSHRVLCADATVKANVDRLMAGEKADMVFTDPPYGMNLQADYSKMHAGGKKYANVIGDDKPFDPGHLLDLAKEVFLWGGDYYCQKLPPGGSWTVWNKLNSSKYEGTETVNTIGNGFELCWSKVAHKRVIRNCLWHGSIYNEGKDEERKPGTSVVIRRHPTQKPIKLFAEMISDFSKSEDLVLDFYLGSGSTLIACEKTKRRCFGMEIEPLYVDVICARFQQFSGKKAYRLNPDGTKTAWDALKPA